MRFQFHVPLIATMSAIVFASAVYAGDKPPAPKLVNEFLGKYCAECHDADVHKGDRNFEKFALPLKSTNDLIDARDIIDQLTLKEMPPKKADQPTLDERLAMIRALRDGSSTAFKKMESTGSHTALRRLSSREYENTLAVLFGRRVDTLGLTADFPKEKTTEHMDTVGKSLVTSGFLVDQYFQSANRLVEARLGKPVMEPKQWHFDKHFVQYEELQGPHKDVFNFRYLNIYEQPNTDTRQGGYGHIEDFQQGVPVAGLYDLEVEAQAMHRDTHYDPKIFGIDFSEPFILGVVPGDITKGHIHYPQPIEPLLASTVVPDEKPTVLKFRVWLEAGQTPRFIFPNGPYESRASVVTINQRYKDELFDKGAKSGDVSRSALLRKGQLPHIRISDIKINGPVVEQGGSAEEIAVFGKDGFKPERAVEQLDAFAEKAYRRPLTDADRKPIHAMYDKRIAEQATPRQAALDALKLILCSPSFLYFSEITDEKAKTLKPFDLATRLSYALWAVPPDDALLASAKPGKLTQDVELKQQIQRMMNDDRINGFINGFLDSWLNLRDLGSQPPPRETNRAFYAEDLPTSMKTEARLFFHDLLKNNGSVARFIDADYTFADKKLAKLYELPEKDNLRLADGFKKVSLNANNHRGGLLGMAAVLTVSANGVETSPVTRGVWVSENILGVPPPPPPDVVPAIDTDTTGTKTIRDRLAKHRADPVCAECHRKIDPFGFSLESFDPVGRWRVNYAKSGNNASVAPKNAQAPEPKKDQPPAPKETKAPEPKSNKPTDPKEGKPPGPNKGKQAASSDAKPAPPKVDPSGELPSGETYADFASFKKLIGDTREDLFTRHLIRSFLTYSTGRKMEFADSFIIDDLHDKVKKQGLGLRTLMVECLMSEIFRSR